MEVLLEILQVLDKQEISYINKKLNNPKNKFNKIKSLFQLITKKRSTDENFYAEKLYGKKADNSFRVTKARLKKIMEDSLINDHGLTSYNAEYINNSLIADKRLLIAKVLLGRGASNSASILLKQIIQAAKKYNLYEQLYQAEKLLFRHNYVYMSVNEFNEHSEMLKKLSEIRTKEELASILYYSSTKFLAGRTLKTDEEFEKLERELKQIKQYHQETGSPLIRFQYLMLQIYVLQVKKSFDQAYTKSQEFFELVKSEPAVHSTQRIGMAFVHLTENAIARKDFETAKKHSQEILKIYNEKEINYLISLDLIFRTYFYSDSKENAEKYLEVAKGHPLFDKSKIRRGKWMYYQACLEFKEGNFKNALRSLDEATPILVDKLGWNIYFRTLEIMTLYELNYGDLLDNKIENLLQYIKRVAKDIDIEYPELLSELIKKWQKNNYNFRKTIKENGTLIEKVHELAGNFPSQNELIRFVDWLSNKEK